jgi:Tol biopolymer transport system component
VSRSLGALVSVGLLVAMVASLAALPGASASPVAYPGTKGKIVFVSSRGGGGLALYTMKANGHGVHRITAEAPQVGQPVWSPDGTQIAYVRSGRLVIVDDDGTPSATLSPDGGVRFPSWNPAGDRLAFEINDSIAVVGADDSPWSYVKERLGGTISYWEPSWSPLGTKIAYVTGGGDYSGSIGVMNSDGSGAHEITSGRDMGEIDTTPDWSPNGKKIAFVRYVDCAGGHCVNAVYVMNANGSGLHLVKRNAATPSWSPDGKKILFVRRVGGNSEIFVMNADGSGVKRLTKNSWSDFSPDWQPE